MILFIGATGQLGTAVRKILPSDSTFVSRADLNLSRPDMVRPFIEASRPELIINCVAYTAVDQAESDSETEYAVNSLSVEDLASTAASTGSRYETSKPVVAVRSADSNAV